MAGLDDLAGGQYGPIPVEVTAGRVAEFVAVTGDEPDRWRSVAPPMFASAALFAVAPRFLADPAVVPYTRSLIHSEQRFEWEGDAVVGDTVQVTGRVGSVRRRGPLEFVGFELSADSDRGPWLTGSAQFLMSKEPAAGGTEATEPAATDRPPVDESSGVAPLPPEGGSLDPIRCGASRLDLIRYAAVTQDWNPIHWDHTSAVAAGLSGTIVHGLLMAAWLGRAATGHAAGQRPLQSLVMRFRKPLRPAAAATVTGSVVAVDSSGADLDLAVESGGDRVVTARARVTA